MIDLQQLADDLYEPLMDYIQPPQLIIGSQRGIKEQMLKNGRLIYSFSEPYNIDNEPVGYTTRIVTSDNPDFEDDVEYIYAMFPRIRLSIVGFDKSNGNKLFESLNKCMHWFKIPHLGQRFFDDSKYDIVIKEVFDIQDRTTLLEEELENRFGFDITLQIKEEVKVREDIIEELNIKLKE